MLSVARATDRIAELQPMKIAVARFSRDTIIIHKTMFSFCCVVVVDNVFGVRMVRSFGVCGRTDPTMDGDNH